MDSLFVFCLPGNRANGGNYFYVTAIYRGASYFTVTGTRTWFIGIEAQSYNIGLNRSYSTFISVVYDFIQNLKTHENYSYLTATRIVFIIFKSCYQNSSHASCRNTVYYNRLVPLSHGSIGNNWSIRGGGAKFMLQIIIQKASLTKTARYW